MSAGACKYVRVAFNRLFVKFFFSVFFYFLFALVSLALNHLAMPYRKWNGRWSNPVALTQSKNASQKSTWCTLANTHTNASAKGQAVKAQGGRGGEKQSKVLGKRSGKNVHQKLPTKRARFFPLPTTHMLSYTDSRSHSNEADLPSEVLKKVFIAAWLVIFRIFLILRFDNHCDGFLPLRKQQ